MDTFNTEMKDLLLTRLEEKKKQGKLFPIHQLGRTYTPDEILNEAKQGTQAGEEFLMAEKKFMDELKRRMP